MSVSKRYRYAGEAAPRLVAALQSANQEKAKTEPTMMPSSGGVPSRSPSRDFELDLGRQGSFARSMGENPQFPAIIARDLNDFEVNAGLAQPKPPTA